MLKKKKKEIYEEAEFAQSKHYSWSRDVIRRFKYKIATLHEHTRNYQWQINDKGINFGVIVSVTSTFCIFYKLLFNRHVTVKAILNYRTYIDIRTDLCAKLPRVIKRFEKKKRSSGFFVEYQGRLIDR